jgi:hypothetical protein
MYTLQGKTRPTRHVHFSPQSIYTRRMLPVSGPRTWHPSMSRRQSWTESLLPIKRAPDTIHSTPADRSTSPYPVSLPSKPMKQWRKPNIHQQQATRFTGPISLTCDWYVQYLLMWANRTVLNRHRWGLQPWRCRLGTYPLPDLPNQLSPLSHSGLARSPFNQVLTTRPKCWVLKNLWPSRGLSTTQPSTVAYIYA